MILVFGETGQVARELARAAPGATFLGRSAADLSDPARCSSVLRDAQPDVVINAAAYTAVDQAESDETNAHTVNCDAPGAMAQACADLDIPFVHISTDYVFDGTGNLPFSPDDPTNPLGAYGRTKRAGEIAVARNKGRYAILRTSWVFSAHGQNFLKTMLRLGQNRNQLNVVADQIGGPTPASGIAQACLTLSAALIETPQKAGIYHYAGTPNISWAGFARHIFDCAGLDVDVTDIASANYPTAAARPLNSRLECGLLKSQFGIERPDWKAAVTDIVEELTQ